MNLQAVNQRQQAHEDKETDKAIRDFNRSEQQSTGSFHYLLYRTALTASINANDKAVAALRAVDCELSVYWEIKSLTLSTDRDSGSDLVVDSD